MPAAVHHIKHAPIARVFGFRQPENIETGGAGVAEQVAVHHIAHHHIEQAVLVDVEHIGGHADLILRQRRRFAHRGKAQAAGFD